MLTSIIALTSVTQIVLSVFVFLRARHNLSNRLFFFIGIATLGWALCNYLTVIFLNSPDVIYLVRLILFFVVVQNAAFYLFARTFPDTAWKHSRKGLRWYAVFTIIAAALTLSPFVFTAVDAQNGIPVTTAGPGIMVFIAHAAFSITVAFKSLFRKMHRAVGAEKSQLRLLLFAAFLTWIIVPITNFAITPLLKTTLFIEFSPLYTFAFASIIAFSMFKHKLFDIRFFVLRGSAYGLSMLLMTFIYVIPSVFLIAALTDIALNTELLFFSIILSVLLAIFYEYIKGYFNSLTNNIFLRRYYEPQEVLNRLSDLLVGTIDADTIKEGSRKILQDVLRTKALNYWLETDGHPELGHLITRLSKAQKQRKIIVIDELSANPDLLQQLSDNDIAMIVRLRTTHGDLGFMTLGYKESGEAYSSRDLRLLSIAADEIAISLQNAIHFAEIQEFNLTLQQKVDDATRKLRGTNEKLKELDEAKDEFISMASHQLRTPLTSVKGYISMVLEGDAGKVTKEQRKMLEQAFTSSQRMVYLISDLLNVSRLKTGKFVIEPSKVNLAALVSQEVDQLVETAKTKNLHLVYNKPDTFPDAMLDETKIRQVIMNFVDNAIYYTPQDGEIEIALADTPHAIELTVKDSGIGVPKHEQHHLFTKFYRAQNAKHVRPDGTGLGLFMAKKVIVAQGGALIFKSEEGKGSTFGFSFPKHKTKSSTSAKR